MAVVNSPSVPVRLDSFTRKVKLLLALGVFAIVCELKILSRIQNKAGAHCGSL
jgi:hypothetical protein